MTRAVITGVGVVSPFGVGTAAFWEGLSLGRSAVGPIRCFDAASFATRVAGEVPVTQISAAWMLDQLRLTRSVDDDRAIESLADSFSAWERSGAFRDRKLAFGLLAAHEAWQSAGAESLGGDAWLCLALGLEQALLEDFAPIFRERRIEWALEAEATLPRTRFRAPIDGCLQLVSDTLGLRGPRVVHSSACAAGALALAHAARLIERGDATLVVCGGADSMVNPLGVGGMSRLGAPSPRNEPDACRPFDRRRDGLVIGEGAAIFVLEAAERAIERGARPLARVLGWGSTQDGYKATAPRPDGSAAQRAIERAIERAGLSPGALGYINAHGTGTPLNDPAEVRAIRAALGASADRVPVSSIKGAVGHLMAAAGAIELAACLLAFERDLLPGTAHHQVIDPECDIDIIGEAPRALRVDSVLSNSFGFGGQNASVILGRYVGA